MTHTYGEDFIPGGIRLCSACCANCPSTASIMGSIMAAAAVLVMNMEQKKVGSMNPSISLFMKRKGMELERYGRVKLGSGRIEVAIPVETCDSNVCSSFMKSQISCRSLRFHKQRKKKIARGVRIGEFKVTTG